MVCATLRVVVNCIVNDLIMVWDTLHNKKEKKHKGKHLMIFIMWFLVRSYIKVTKIIEGSEETRSKR